ncbi:MAG: hypothetical protein COB66_06095 [Coxiella sp. (in: Bacteria)]|nr:MAG: hypothetical protein COB66_06095 [Coxiella sp. (in: g-proteobacteria)]
MRSNSIQSIESEQPSKLCLWLDYAGLVVLLLMPFLTFLGIATCDISIVLIAVLFVVRSVILRDFAWLTSRWVQIGLLLWLYVIILSPYALFQAKLSFKQALPFGRFVVFGAALQYWLLNSEKNRRYFMYALTATLLLIAVNVVQSFVTGLTIFGKSSIAYDWTNRHIEWVWNRHFQRIAGLNGKLNSGILLTWFAIPVLTFLLIQVKQYSKVKIKLLSVLGVVVILAAVLVTGERMALLELLLGALLMFILMPSLRKQLLLIGLISAIVLATLLYVDKGLWNRNVTQIIHSTHHFGSNAYGNIFKTALAISSAHPIFGIGLKQYFLASKLPQYIGMHGINSHPQNVYLEWLVGAGVLGLMAFLLLLGTWCSKFWRARKHLRASPIAMGVLIALMLRCWPLASTTSFFFSWGGITFWLMGGWLLALCYRSHEKSTMS